MLLFCRVLHWCHLNCSGNYLKQDIMIAETLILNLLMHENHLIHELLVLRGIWFPKFYIWVFKISTFQNWKYHKISSLLKGVTFIVSFQWKVKKFLFGPLLLTRYVFANCKQCYVDFHPLLNFKSMFPVINALVPFLNRLNITVSLSLMARRIGTKSTSIQLIGLLSDQYHSVLPC